MWFTLARSNRYSPGPARLAPGVRTVWSGMGVPPLTRRVFASLDHTLARHAAANWAWGGRLVTRPQRGVSARPGSAGPEARYAPAPDASHPGHERRLRRGGLGGAFLQHEVVIDHIEGGVDFLPVRRHAGRLLDEVDDQRLLHAVDHVGLDIGAAALEQMGDDAMIAGRIGEMLVFFTSSPTGPSIGMV